MNRISHAWNVFHKISRVPVKTYFQHQDIVSMEGEKKKEKKNEKHKKYSKYDVGRMIFS